MSTSTYPLELSSSLLSQTYTYQFTYLPLNKCGLCREYKNKTNFYLNNMNHNNKKVREEFKEKYQNEMKHYNGHIMRTHVGYSNYHYKKTDG